MALWRAPWNRIFAQTAAPDEDEFSLVDAADVTSQYGVQSLHSEPMFSQYDHNDDPTEQASLHRATSLPSLLIAAHFTPNRIPLADSTVREHEHMHSTVDRRVAFELGHAGRHDNSHAFEDMRSGDKSYRRQRADMNKYYGYRAVKNGQRTAPHRVKEDKYVFQNRDLPAELPVKVPTKREFYNMAQEWPRPPSYHKRPNSKDRWPWTNRFERRRDARKHSRQQFDLNEELSLAYEVDAADERFLRSLEATCSVFLEAPQLTFAELQAKADDEYKQAIALSLEDARVTAWNGKSLFDSFVLANG